MTRWLALPAVLVVGLLAACGSDNSSSTGTSASTGSDTAASTAASTTSADSSAPADKGGKGAKVAYISPVAAQPGQQEINHRPGDGRQGARLDEGRARRQPVAGQAGRQRRHAITQGRNAITSWTLDPAPRPARTTRAIAQGIPVVGMNSEGKGVSATVWWSTASASRADRTSRSAVHRQAAPAGR